MCYGCELKSTLGLETEMEYLEIRADYYVIHGQIHALLNRMDLFERTLTDREQRKAWHAVRKRIKSAKKEIIEWDLPISPTEE